MISRTFSLADRVIGEIDRAIKVLWAPPRSDRESPADLGEGVPLEAEERLKSGRLMRVNHAGEVAAQALYRGQALTARDAAVSAAMCQAAAEEMDHLAWCQQRLHALRAPTSLFNPLWYAGSFLIGAAAGAIGDRTSLGFIAETEKQVESHLREHLELLPEADETSRAILQQMTHDEMRHGAAAAALGGSELPFSLCIAMRFTAGIMTRASYWL